MADIKEVIVTSEVSGQSWNTCFWDLHSGGSLQTYKGGSAAPRTMSMIGDQYLMSAVMNKSMINIWALQKQDQVMMKMVSPGNIRAMAVSPCGQFCVAAIMDKIHLWQVCTGELLAAVVGHYQNVNTLRFTRDGAYIISGGDDGLVIVWSLPRMIEGDHQKGMVYTWSHHSLSVTDIYVGQGHSTARLVSSSLDHTCKMYDLVSGTLVCSFVFDAGITSVVMDNAEMRLFAGSSHGDVYVTNLFNQPMTQERRVTDTEKDVSTTCKGHTKQVTCLSVSLDGSQLVSGSHDWTVKVWDVSSCQCVRTLHHKGAITNAFITIAPRGILEHTHTKPTQPIQTFKRFLVQPSSMTNAHGNVKVESVNLHISGLDKTKDQSTVIIKQQQPVVVKRLVGQRDTSPRVKQILSANTQLYRLAVKQLLSESAK